MSGEIDFNLNDGETYEKYMTYDKTSAILTLTSEWLGKVKALSSDTVPQNKKVSIVFKINAEDNGVGYITNEFHLIKIKKIEDDDIKTILNKLTYTHSFKGVSDDKTQDYVSTFKVGSGNFLTGEYVIDSEETSNNLKSLSQEDISEINTRISHYFPILEEISKVNKKGENEEVSAGFYKVIYGITWGDDFESTRTEIPIRFKLGN